VLQAGTGQTAGFEPATSRVESITLIGGPVTDEK